MGSILLGGFIFLVMVVVLVLNVEMILGVDMETAIAAEETEMDFRMGEKDMGMEEELEEVRVVLMKICLEMGMVRGKELQGFNDETS